MEIVETTYTLHYLSLSLYGAGLAAALASLRWSRFPRFIAIALAAAGLASGGALLLLRWGAGGYFPVTGLFSTLQIFTLCVVAVSLYFALRYGADRLLPASLGLAVAALFAAVRGPVAIRPMPASLDTPLFFLHVSTSFAAYGLFTVAGVLGLYNLAGVDPGRAPGRGPRIMDESLFIGYVLFTWCMIAGSLWAYLAWGAYWTWNIKALWSSLLWFYFSGVLHLRGRMGWQGWQVNVLAVVGLVLTLFTWLGIGLLFSSNHPLL